MDFLLAVLLIADIALLALVLYLKREIDKEEQSLLEMHNKIGLLALESKIAPQFSGDTEELKGSLTNLAKKLFQLVKAKYRLEGVTTYSELVDRLTHMDVPMKAELIDFFSTMVIIEYSKKPIPASKRHKLREEVIALIKKLGES